MQRKRLIFVIIIILLILGAGLWFRHRHTTADTASQTTHTTSTSAASTTSPAFNKTRYSTTDPASLWVIVNKQHPLNPITYAPADLRTPNVTLRIPGAAEMQMRDAAATALDHMFADAKTAGYKLQVSTAYRGYAYQKTLYDSYTADEGQAAADQGSARPGYSEHQTGWAVDIRNQANTCSLEACFGDTPEAKWLAANAYKYGFLLRYPADKVAITGYEYEPWHFRYIGTDLSTEMHNEHIETMEEFFNVSGGTTYN